MRESTIERQVCAWAENELGCIVRKFISPGNRGVPDRMFIFPRGTVAFIEFKAPGKKPTALQMRELKILNERDVYALWTDNFNDACAWLRGIDLQDDFY